MYDETYMVMCVVLPLFVSTNTNLNSHVVPESGAVGAGACKEIVEKSRQVVSISCIRSCNRERIKRLSLPRLQSLKSVQAPKGVHAR